MPKTICISGKNDIACLFLEWAVANHSSLGDYVVVTNRDDTGKHSWQRSLRFTADKLGIREASLQELYSIPDLYFLSLEYDRIILPKKFSSSRLYNVHFSALPKYRGVATSVWPLVLGETMSGVTLHRIDAGIDTGEIISQDLFEVDKNWNAYDLYKAYLDQGLELIRRSFLGLINDKVTSTPQPTVGATYFGRDQIDYGSPNLNFKQTAWQVHNMLRAHTFHAYQYPVHPDVGPLFRTRISDALSQNQPGTYRPTSRWSGQLSTLDYDLEVWLSPYSQLYAWFQGNEERPDDLEEVLAILDLDLVDSNGWTLLAIASYYGNLEACRLLLENGANPNAVGPRGTTPLMYAKEHFLKTKDSSVLSLLLAEGADILQTDVHGKSIRSYIEQGPEAEQLHLLLST